MNEFADLIVFVNEAAYGKRKPPQNVGYNYAVQQFWRRAFLCTPTAERLSYDLILIMLMCTAKRSC